MQLDFQIPDPKIVVDPTAQKDDAESPTSAEHDAGLDTKRHGDLGPSRQVQDLGELRAGGQKYLEAGRGVEVH